MRLIDADAIADNIAVLLERNPKLIAEWLANIIEDEITEAPTIEAEPVRRGRWVETDKDEPCFYYCSNCGSAWDDETDYCPSCGARMEEQE